MQIRVLLLIFGVQVRYLRRRTPKTHGILKLLSSYMHRAEKQYWLLPKQLPFPRLVPCEFECISTILQIHLFTAQ
jgi:hypothetical protein